MNTLLRQTAHSLRPLRSIRQIATTLPRLREAYQPTISSIIPPSNAIQVSAIVPSGLHLSNDVVVPGAAILLGGRAYLWNVDLPSEHDEGGVRSWAGWDIDRFRMFEIIAPRPGPSLAVHLARQARPPLLMLSIHPAELLILGTGPTTLPPPLFLTSYMNSLGIQLDVMNSVSLPCPSVLLSLMSDMCSSRSNLSTA